MSSSTLVPVYHNIGRLYASTASMSRAHYILFAFGKLFPHL